MNERLQDILALELSVIYTVACFFVPQGGADLFDHYIDFANGCVECASAPHHLIWFLWPMTLISPRFVWPAWTLFSALTIWWSCRKLGTNPVWVMLSWPMFAVWYQGQMEAVVVLGLTLAMNSRTAYVRGLGLVLASVKPQIAGLAMLVLLFYEKERLKTLVIPGLVLAASLLRWGWTWPIEWFLHHAPPRSVWTSTLYPVGLLAFLAVPLLSGKRAKVTGTLLASGIGMPYVQSYTHIVPMAFAGKYWWVVPLSWSWFLFVPLFGGTRAMIAGTLVLVALLAWLVLEHIQSLHSSSLLGRKTTLENKHYENTFRRS